MGALALALALSGCASGGQTTSSHASLDANLGGQSVYVTVTLGEQTQNDGLTLALDAQTGALRWKTDTGGTAGAPAVAGGAVYMAPEDASIRSLDAATGKQRWSYTRTTGVSGQYGYDGYAVVSGDTVYIASDSGAVFALDTASGKPRWQRTWPNAGDTIYAAPAVDGGMVFAAVGGPDGGGYALDATTGKIVWQTSHVEGFDAVPLAADGVVYFGSQAPDTLTALDEKTGAMRWQAGASGINAPPITGGGLVYVAGADQIIRAFHVQDGSPAWTFQTGGNAGNALIGTGAALTLANGVLYAGSQGGDLYALDAATGKQRWSVAVSSPIDQPPAVADGAIFITTEAAQVYAYRASDGVPAWSYSAGKSSDGANITSGPVVASATGQ